MFCSIVVGFVAFQCSADTSTLVVNATSNLVSRRIPDTFLGVFLEEINHGVEGGLWAELVNNRGFEAGKGTPSFYPWSIIGDNSSIFVSTNFTSCFEKNKVALRMEVLCGTPNPCPSTGNIEKGKKYKVVFYVKSVGITDFQISFVGADGVKLALLNVRKVTILGWKRMEGILKANATSRNASLQITTTTKGIYLLDQVSAMPMDTYKGHGFRKDLFQMVADLKPRFLRFPGGCFVEGEHIENAFRWKESVGPWEERPGHLNDVWNYWTDDGFGYFEGLQLAEDLNALPDALDGIEFASGSPSSKWGSVRAAMGHPKPFVLRHVGIGNEDCGKANYQGKTNYLAIHDAIRSIYPDIKMISNCDGSDRPIGHPADLFDYHIYTDATDMLHKSTKFDKTSRSGPKAFISEYAVWKEDAGMGSLLSAVSEAAFLIGLEKNSDIVEMVCYAPLFLNINELKNPKKWIPDAIVFDSYRLYGTPSYWVQKIFSESNGAILLPSTLVTNSSNLIASAINWKPTKANQNHLRIKVVNFGTIPENLHISIDGLNSNVTQSGSTKTVLTSANKMDENSFLEPRKVVPQQISLKDAAKDMNVILPPFSVTSFDLLI
ncbi:hypothetical protein RIF29_18196 [Crotalaria pallida]|uniref:non-reducing end alpha-L-arabinofuranosidase n=1 Tax=Crotalaria pallida TaxID=3830 RepID=A0AAN9FIG6_CROPI